MTQRVRIDEAIGRMPGVELVFSEPKSRAQPSHTDAPAVVFETVMINKRSYVLLFVRRGRDLRHEGACRRSRTVSICARFNSCLGTQV